MFVLTALTALFAVAPRADAQTSTYNRICDPAFENCRQPIIDLIRNETVGIDVAFWFMEDPRYANELIARWNAGVPVRVTMDSEAFTAYGYTNALYPVQLMRDAGIPIREKTGNAGILHFKTFIFAGQGVVEFSGANFSDEAFVYHTPYSDYVDEVIMFSNEASIVDSFKTRYDDIWTAAPGGTQGFSNWANITGPLVRNYPTTPIDPELNFSPWNSFATRALQRYAAETSGIDAIMYRITDQRHTNAMIAAKQRGVTVRIITDPTEYRNPAKIWTSWNVDRMYMAGIQVRIREHAGLSHEKLTVLHGQGMTILGSSNWTSASDQSQHEHNIFSTKPWMYNYAADHFNRKWFNLAPAVESGVFVPGAPDAPLIKSPANTAQDQPLTVTLRWNGGLWAHRYDVYFGTDPTNLTKILNDANLGPNESGATFQSTTVSNLAQSTTYYWKVVSRTMANVERAGPVWSFRTQGTPPASGSNDIVLWTANAPSITGWTFTTDTTAAGGKRLGTANAGLRNTTPLESPSQYIELGFWADAGVPYRLWIRGKAVPSNYENDSVWAQFNDSVTATGAAQWRIGTTSAANVTIEDCTNCGVSGWGWNDTATGAGTLGPLVYFAQSGGHRIRLQVREDGLAIDQIVLSPDTFMNTSPGPPRDDGTIYPEQKVAALDPNFPPTVSLTGPANGSSFTAPATVTMTATASDQDGAVTRVDFLVDGVVVGSDATAPYSFDWSTSAPGTRNVTARAIDNRGDAGTSPPTSISIVTGNLQPGEETVLYAATAPVAVGWTVTADATAAGGSRLQNPNAGAPKIATPLENPGQYFEMTFNAIAGRPYRLWIRGKAIGNTYENDAVHVQFDQSVLADGVTPTWRIGTTSGATIQIEDCTSCGLSNWGWNDASAQTTTPLALGPVVYFATTGPQRLRVQVREDGLGIDQIVVSSVYYMSSAPGLPKNDTTVLPATP